MRIRRGVWVCLFGLCIVYVFIIRYFLGDSTSPEEQSIRDGSLDSVVSNINKINEGVNLIYQFPVFIEPTPQNKKRTKEYLNTMIINICNPDVASVNILTERDTDEEAIRSLLHKVDFDRFTTEVIHYATPKPYQPHWITYKNLRNNMHKLYFKTINHWLLYSDAFQFANTHLKNKLCTVQNADISFISGFNLSTDLFLPPFRSDSPPGLVGRVYAISRHEAPTSTCQHMSVERCLQPTIRGSYDAFVFLSPVPEVVVKQVPFVQNIMGAESRVIWSFKCANYSVTNPCLNLVTLHRHCESKRVRSQHDGREPFVRYDGNGPFAWPRTGPAPDLQYVAPEIPEAEYCFAKA